MGSIEDADLLAFIAAVPERATPDETEAVFDAMPIAELASMWGALQRPRRDDPAGAAWSAMRAAASLANSFAIAASLWCGLPASRSQAAR